MQFPAGSPPHGRMVVHGHQTRLGFLALGDDRRVLVVEPGSDAERQGLRVGDRIVDVNGTAVENAKEMARAILLLGTRDDRQSSSVLRSPVDPLAFDESFDMTVERDGSRHAITIHPAATLPIHPTQVYSSISNLLLFSVLLSFYPLRRRDGEVVALFAMLYPISRFLIEYLRYDEPALIDGLTISQNLSILLFMLGAMVWLSVRRRPAQYLRRSALSAASKSAA
jgi:phosphatidylglycerol:prolipoprotein diacylglycerol transferase